MVRRAVLLGLLCGFLSCLESTPQQQPEPLPSQGVGEPQRVPDPQALPEPRGLLGWWYSPEAKALYELRAGSTGVQLREACREPVAGIFNEASSSITFGGFAPFGGAGQGAPAIRGTFSFDGPHKLNVTTTFKGLSINVPGIKTNVPASTSSRTFQRLRTPVACRSGRPVPRVYSTYNGITGRLAGVSVFEAFEAALVDSKVDVAHDGRPEKTDLPAECRDERSGSVIDCPEKVLGAQVLECGVKDVTYSGLRALQHVVLASDFPEIFPGALVQSDTLDALTNPNRVVMPVPVGRNAIKAAVSTGCPAAELAEFDPSSHIDFTRASNLALKDCVGNGSGFIQIDGDKSYTKFKVDVKISGSYAGFSASNQTTLDKTATKNVLRVLIQQTALTLSSALPADKRALFSEPDAAFGKPTTMSPDNPPIFISEVGYGQQIYIEMRFLDENTHVRNNLEAGFNRLARCKEVQANCLAVFDRCNGSADKAEGADAKARARENCESRLDSCKERDHCDDNAMAELTADISADAARETVSLTAVNFGGGATLARILEAASSGGKDIPQTERIAKLTEALNLSTPAKFSELRKISFIGLQPTDQGRVAVSAYSISGREDDCHRRGAPSEGFSYHLKVTDIDDDVWVWPSSRMGSTTDEYSASSPNGYLAHFQAVREELIPIETLPLNQYITVKLGNGGCFWSGGTVELIRKQNGVLDTNWPGWRRQVPGATRWCGYFFHATLKLEESGVVRPLEVEECAGLPTDRCAQP